METQVLAKRTPRTAPTQLKPPQVTEALAASRSSAWRRGFFRVVRLVIACALVFTAVGLARRHVTMVSSDQAFLNGAVTALRAPIGGVLRLDAVEPGAELPESATVFRVDNARFGNVEAMGQFHWLQEVIERLRVEVAEAELRFEKQEELFKHHEVLFKEKLLPRVQFIEEETKVGLCRITRDNRREQLRAAEARSRGIEQQIALQKQALAAMPFAGVVWSVHAQNGGEVAAQETVLRVLDPRRVWVDAFIHEKHTTKFHIGAPVMVRAVDGAETWTGRVESVRGGAGRMSPEQFVAVPANELARRRVAVRIRLESANPFGASEFFGIGRSVKVTLLGQ